MLMLVFVYSYVSMVLCQFIDLSETLHSCRKIIFGMLYFCWEDSCCA
uniref:Uncharacterized protein n=1 Tax=Setaria viridis TaxID=4556 RepID=A0A4V6D3H2_SETVI|nr:hypothetical protein SEVIR_8G254950v2 [Setaria viridis]